MFKSRGYLNVTKDSLPKSLLYIPEDKTGYAIKSPVLLDPGYYGDDTDISKQKSMMAALIADRISSGLEGYAVRNTLEIGTIKTDTGKILDLDKIKKKDESVIHDLKKSSTTIISVDIIENKKGNIIKIFYPIEAKEDIKKQVKALAINILNRLAENKGLRLEGTSVIPVYIEDNERYSLLSSEKLSLLIEIGMKTKDNNLKGKSPQIADIILGAMSSK